MNKTFNKDFQKQPLWVFFTLIIILISSASNFNELILDFQPNWSSYNKWIKSIYIGVFIFIMIGAYWAWHIKEDYPDPDNPSTEEFFKKSWKRILIKSLFKDYFFNIITLRVISLCCCRIISLFVKKTISPYSIHSFNIPKTWPDYQKITNSYFKKVFRVTITKSDNSDDFFYKTYEVKFKRDFQHIELRWNDKSNTKFQSPIQGKYGNIFSKDKKDIKIFTWIVPFGLYWNLIRIIKNLFPKNKTYRFLRTTRSTLSYDYVGLKTQKQASACLHPLTKTSESVIVY